MTVEVPVAGNRDAVPASSARANAGEEPLVAIRDLSKYYIRGDQVIPVLVDIDLDVHGIALYPTWPQGVAQTPGFLIEYRERQSLRGAIGFQN